MEQSPLIEIGLPIALFIIMIGMGLTLTPADFRREFHQPKGLVIGSVLQLLFMPVIGLLLMGLPGMAAGIAVGVVIVAACPGGTTSNLIAYLARGNVALSIVLTVVASLATIATLPFWVNLALDRVDAGGATVRLPFVRTVLLLTILILLPVSIGMIIRRANAALALRAERLVSLFGAFVLLALIVLIAVSNWDRLGSLLAQSGPACALLNLSGILLGLGVGRFSGLAFRDSLTIAVEMGIKNSTIGLLVSMSMLNDTEMAVPSAVYGMMMYAFGFALIAFGRRFQRSLQA